MKTSPATAARERAGYAGTDGLQRLADKLGVCPRHLRHHELHGRAGDLLRFKWSRLVGASEELLWHRPEYLAARDASAASQSVNDAWGSRNAPYPASMGFETGRGENAPGGGSSRGARRRLKGHFKPALLLLDGRHQA